MLGLSSALVGVCAEGSSNIFPVGKRLSRNISFFPLRIVCQASTEPCCSEDVPLSDGVGVGRRDLPAAYTTFAPSVSSLPCSLLPAEPQPVNSEPLRIRGCTSNCFLVFPHDGLETSFVRWAKSVTTYPSAFQIPKFH